MKDILFKATLGQRGKGKIGAYLIQRVTYPVKTQFTVSHFWSCLSIIHKWQKSVCHPNVQLLQQIMIEIQIQYLQDRAVMAVKLVQLHQKLQYSAVKAVFYRQTKKGSKLYQSSVKL
ncbi:Hypothetical_protein [Hexamita inflata]|uniref:Hypothetical_protein n=1 Tax=Hexamita inflata TaxID=28002 RepID=A0AA86QCJ5_9EUKA|nr:Hypothetical protein HINF_LOCUS44271 [Hexamita inflata]